MSQLKTIRLRLLIEGSEIPIMGISIQNVVNMPTSASISIPPVPAARHIQPRSNVAVFFYDSDESRETEDKKWKLLFNGEVLGYGFDKNHDSRSFVLSCYDMSNYWQTIILHFFTGFDFDSIAQSQQMLLGISSGSLIDKDLLNSYENRLNTIVSNYNGSIDSAIRFLITEGAWLNAFFLLGYARVKMGDRIFSIEDESILKLIAKEQSARIFGEFAGKNPSDGTFMSILQMILDTIMYQYISIPTPMYFPARNSQFVVKQDDVDGARSNRNRLREFILKPHTMLSAPPMCNVLFPEDFSGCSYRRSFMDEGTRLRLASDLREVSGLPQWVVGIVGGQYTGNGSERELDIAFKESADNRIPSHRLLTKEEQVKGIVPRYFNLKSLIFTDYSSAIKDIEDRKTRDSSSGTEVKSLSPLAQRLAEIELPENTNQASTSEAAIETKNLLRQIADYQYRIERHSSRQASVVCTFNPYLVVGFPALLVDPALPMLGEIQQIAHVIDANGSASTQIVMGYCREGLSYEETMNFIPNWINEAYRVDKIGASVYKPYFDTKSIVDYAATISGSAEGPSTPVRNQEAVKAIVKKYSESDQNQRMDILQLKRRPIATIDEYYKFIGAEKSGSGYATSNSRVPIDFTDASGKSLYTTFQEAVESVVPSKEVPGEDTEKSRLLDISLEDGKRVKLQQKQLTLDEYKIEALDALSNLIGPFSNYNKTITEALSKIYQNQIFADTSGDLDPGIVSVTLGDPNAPFVVNVSAPEEQAEDKSGTGQSKWIVLLKALPDIAKSYLAYKGTDVPSQAKKI